MNKDVGRNAPHGRHTLMLFWILMLASMGSRPVDVRELVEREMVRIAVGPLPEQVSNRECDGPGTPCAAGFIFPGRADTLYFYDNGQRNLKVVVPASGPGARFVIPGPTPVLDAGEILVDGRCEADGTLLLLADAGQGRGQRLLQRRPAGAWQPVPGKSALQAAPRRDDRSWMRDIVADGATSLVPLGVDAIGNRYVETRRSWSTVLLEVFDSEGRRVASKPQPERAIWKAVVGRGDKWVDPQSGLFECYVTERWLVIVRWSLET